MKKEGTKERKISFVFLFLSSFLFVFFFMLREAQSNWRKRAEDRVIRKKRKEWMRNVIKEFWNIPVTEIQFQSVFGPNWTVFIWVINYHHSVGLLSFCFDSEGTEYLMKSSRWASCLRSSFITHAVFSLDLRFSKSEGGSKKTEKKKKKATTNSLTWCVNTFMRLFKSRTSEKTQSHTD